MAKFLIFFEDAEFYVLRTSAKDTGSSVVYEYEIKALDGETLALNVPGANKVIIQDGVKTTLVDGNFTFSNSMKICFTMSNSATFGTFNEVTFTVDRPTAGVAEYAQFTDTIINYND